MSEIWKAVAGYDGWYEVSDLGRVRSLRHRGKPLKVPWVRAPAIDSRGYHSIALMRDYVLDKWLLHRLVATTFHGPCPEGQECRHLDGNPHNNRADNLAWGTKKENMRDRDLHGTTSRGEHRTLAVFTEEEVRAMRLRHAKGERRADIVRDIVANKRCDPTVVRHILGFRTWKHVH